MVNAGALIKPEAHFKIPVPTWHKVLGLVLLGGAILGGSFFTTKQSQRGLMAQTSKGCD